MCESRLHKGEEITAQLVGNKHITLVTKFLVSGHLCQIDFAYTKNSDYKVVKQLSA